MGHASKRVVLFNLVLITVLIAASAAFAQVAANRYAVILQDPPVAAKFTSKEAVRSAEAKNYRQQIEARQRSLRGELESRTFQVTGSAATLMNALFVIAPASRVAELKSLPGVKDVAPLRRYRRNLNRAVPLVNGPAAWDALAGVQNAGAGIKIGMLDGGIDQTHPAFRDPSLAMPAGYPICSGSDCNFTSNKVIVARSYVRQLAAGSSPANPAADSRPDDYSARDRDGHGTAVASCAAGVTNAGLLTITGIAPKAYLGNYKIYGSPEVNDYTSDDVIVQALEDAIKDGMDIVSFSSGGPAFSGPLDSGPACGNSPGVPCDISAQAFENAAKAGLIIVAAGGNDGESGNFYPAFNTIESPGDAPSVIAVGATTNSHTFVHGVERSFSGFNELAGFSSFGPSTGDSFIKPDLVAVGTSMFMAAEAFDPLGMLYDPSRYSVADGTSFSTPLVAGAAALVKQAHPAFTAAQVKSALVNSASQDVIRDDSGIPVDVQWLGAGKLDAGAAVNASVTADPATVSFGILQSGSLPAIRRLLIANNSSNAVSLNVATVAGQASGANLAADKSSLSLAPGASATVTLTLSGSLPRPGSYHGAVTIQGTGVALRIPYLYLVGSNTAATIITLLGDGFDGTVNQGIPDGIIAFKLVDINGAPITGAPVSFTSRGGGTLVNVSRTTDVYGIATAEPVLGATAGNYSYSVIAGGMSVRFSGTARRQPTIAANGITNAASFESKPIAPGSYISIFGAGLSDTTDGATTASLPLAIDYVNVSFDAPSAGISVPGHLIYVSPSQVNVQVPWELQGQTSVQMKVTIDYSTGNVVTVPVAAYAPAFFEFSPGRVAALDLQYNPIGSANPARRGQIVQLFANGLGPVTNQPASGDPAPLSPLSQTQATPVVTIDAQQADISFSGLAPGFPGLYQINATVPSSLSAGNHPITITIGGQTSKASGIYIQ
jgi:uncharacterized protein (TIGR03437 family)